MEYLNILESSLNTYYNSTDISLNVIDALGNELLTLGNINCFCKYIKEYAKESCPCMQTHLLASKQSEKIGEDYIFSCPAGFINFTVPLLENGLFKGAVIAGPFLMDFPDDLMTQDILQKFELNINQRGKINSYLKTLLIIEPAKVRHLSKLLYIVVTSTMEDDRYILKEKNLKYTQQMQISESIQDFKSSSGNTFYPYETEKDLLFRVKNGDIIGAKAILNDLIGHILFSSGGNFEEIRSHTFELCTLLSRSSVEGGADPNEIFGLNHNFLNELNNINNVEDLCYWLVKVLDRFTENVFSTNLTKNAYIIKKAISYINENYKMDVTLDMVANLIHMNSSYFSTLFKKEVGQSFSAYLNKVRIERSKQLLKNSDFSVLDIALQVGFEDQSYFTKVFKSITKMTPKEFKQKQH